MKECEEDLSEEEGFERKGMVGFEKGSERLRKMIKFFGYVRVGSRYSAGRVELRDAQIWVSKHSACRGDMGEPRSWVFLLPILFFTFFFS